MNKESGTAKPLKLENGSEIIIWEVKEPTPVPVHVHRWAWTIGGHQECYDCGKKR